MKKGINILLAVFSLLILISGYMILRELTAQKQQINEFQTLADLVAEEPVANTPGTLANSPGNGAIGADTPTPAPYRNLQPLFEQNPDCIGWIYIENTAVNYPLMHTPKEPEKYLRKSFSKKSSSAGVPFIEANCTPTCDNLILYGHNMKNGTMFADVTKYRDRDYLEAHPVIEMETAQGIKQYTVFAVIQAKNNDSWYGFHSALDEAEYNSYVADIKERALHDTGITPKYGQQLLTLSTCYGKTKSDRILVIGAEK